MELDLQQSFLISPFSLAAYRLMYKNDWSLMMRLDMCTTHRHISPMPLLNPMLSSLNPLHITCINNQLTRVLWLLLLLLLICRLLWILAGRERQDILITAFFKAEIRINSNTPDLITPEGSCSAHSQSFDHRTDLMRPKFTPPPRDSYNA